MGCVVCGFCTDIPWGGGLVNTYLDYIYTGRKIPFKKNDSFFLDSEYEKVCNGVTSDFFPKWHQMFVWKTCQTLSHKYTKNEPNNMSHKYTKDEPNNNGNNSTAFLKASPDWLPHCLF